MTPLQTLHIVLGLLPKGMSVKIEFLTVLSVIGYLTNHCLTLQFIIHRLQLSRIMEMSLVVLLII
jgi:hypothetical protein